MHNDELRARLLAEAVAAVESRGVGVLSVREIAHAAATSTTAVYSLFGNKEGLVRAVLVHAFDSFAAQQAGGDDLTALGTAYVAWALEHPRLYELMFTDALSNVEPTPESQAAAARAIAPLRDGVRQAIEAGFFRPADVDTVVASLWAQVHGMAMLLLANHFPTGADPVAAAMAVIDGWRATPPSADQSD